MSHPNNDIPPRQCRTYGTTRAVRLPNCDYAGDMDVHLTICAAHNRPFVHAGLAEMVCQNVEFYCRRLHYRLYGYCLMPDHLHVLLSPGDSGKPVALWLRLFKSYTTNRHQKEGGTGQLWQRSAHDRVCRSGEVAEKVLTYIVNNPVRAELVNRWEDWRWTKVSIEI